MQLQIHMRKHIYLVNWRIYTALRGVWGVCVYVCVCVGGGGGGGGGGSLLETPFHYDDILIGCTGNCDFVISLIQQLNRHWNI